MPRAGGNTVNMCYHAHRTNRTCAGEIKDRGNHSNAPIAPDYVRPVYLLVGWSMSPYAALSENRAHEEAIAHEA